MTNRILLQKSKLQFIVKNIFVAPVMGHTASQEAKECELVLSGFIRNIKLAQTIPIELGRICFKFYFIPEYFDAKFCGYSYKLSANNAKITKSVTKQVSAYLVKVVQSGVHKWRFEIIKMSGNHMFIGVWKTKYAKSISQDVYYKVAQGKYYGWNIIVKTTTTGDERYNRWYGRETNIRTGNVIEMILDLNNHQLSYSVNDISEGICFADIEKCDYTACIMISHQGDSMQLLSYNSEEYVEQ